MNQESKDLTGIQQHRLSPSINWREKMYIEELKKEFSVSSASFFNCLLTPIENYPPEGRAGSINWVHPTEEERKLVITVIQWLGTCCGQVFVKRVQQLIEQKEKKV